MAEMKPGASLATDAAHDGGLDARVHLSRIAMVLTRSVTPVVVGMPFACLIVWLVWPNFPHGALLGWLALKLATAGLRIHERRSSDRQPGRQSRTGAGHWFLVLLLCDGLAWGLLLVVFPRTEELASSAILYACVIGVTAIGATSLSAWYTANAVFCTAALLPGVFNGLTAGTPHEVFGSIGIAAFLGLLLHDGRLAGRASDELLRRRFEVDRLATERAAALALAERHSAVKSRFLATMSHEMRTPLHGMLGTLQVLREDLPVQHAERLAVIERSGEHLLGLINDVLDLSKIEAGGMQIEQQPCDATHTLREVADLFTPAAQGKGIVLHLDSSLPAPAWMLGDAARLRQVLLNLVGNAVKFTERGQVDITAHRDGDTLIIAVSDTGIGIPAEAIGTVFDAFRQVEDGDTRRYGGTGLGLSISRELARAMGGDLTCTSRHGEGSVFTFELPWRPAAAPAPGAVPSPVEPPPAVRFGGTVLLVDDNAVNLMVAEAMLEKLAVNYVVATNGEEAVEAFERARPALVLMDCHMPVLDGYAATGRIRDYEKREGLGRTPIVAVTANAFDEDRQRCTAAGMDAHLGKPFRESELAAVLHTWLPTD